MWRTSLWDENLRTRIGQLQGELFVQTLQPGKSAEKNIYVDIRKPEKLALPNTTKYFVVCFALIVPSNEPTKCSRSRYLAFINQPGLVLPHFLGHNVQMSQYIYIVSIEDHFVQQLSCHVIHWLQIYTRNFYYTEKCPTSFYWILGLIFYEYSAVFY